jgi:hypothetical protein
MKFCELAIGARFCFRGQRFEKLAMSLAEDEERAGHVFMGDAAVTAGGEPLLLPPAEAARWKPDRRDWADYLSPAPGHR